MGVDERNVLIGSSGLAYEKSLRRRRLRKETREGFWELSFRGKLEQKNRNEDQ